MDRRTFLTAAGVGASAAFLPRVLPAALANLGDADIERRVQELLAKMSLDDKVAQMSGEVLGNGMQLLGYNKFAPTKTPDNQRLGIPGIKFVDGPRGINFKGCTCFPVSIARGASWDADLQKRVGEVMGYEARAHGANYTGAVCINVVRHPSWGRSQETFGEDPAHLGVMGSSLALGIQEHIMACAKHFACNNIEDTRMFVDVKIDERTLREVYLPHFKKCVDAGVASVMCSYNTVNGDIASANKHLITDILKGDWGFKGFIISDFGAVKNGEKSANAGLDVEMPSTVFWGGRLKQLVREGKVPEKRIDDAVTRILREKFRFGLFDKQEKPELTKSVSQAHAQVALEAERKSIVLLKNEKSALPFDRSQIKTVAVIGELADSPNIGDHGSSVVRPPYVVTPLAGIRNKCGKVNVIYDPGRSLETARSVASKADAVVIVAGETYLDEGEGHDRVDLNLSVFQEHLIKGVAEANKRCVVVLEAGGALCMESWKDAVPAIVMAWYPGMEGGNAIAEILFGDINPGGKLPLVFPKSADQLFKFENRARAVEYGYYHGYRWFDKKNLEPAFPFGFGLSYTKYIYSSLRLGKKFVGKDEKLAVQVDVTNMGARAGEEIVQLYVGYNGTKIDRPVKDLRAFAKVALEPGQTKTVSLELNPQDLAWYNPEKGAWQIEDIDYVVMVGPSSRPEDLKLKDTFRIQGA
jgi:beta-glucosidase